MTAEEAQSDRRNRVASGLTIGGSAVVMVVFMALHPTAHTHDLAGFVAETSAGAAFNGFVHGTLMAALVLILIGFTGFAQQLGMRHLLVRAGTVSYSVGVVALLAAATINGFVVPALASKYVSVSGPTLDALAPSLALCHEANGACDRLGIVALSAAMLLWSVVLAKRPGGPRGVGIVGLIFASLPTIALLAGRLPMNVHGFGAFVLLQAIWYLAVAALLVRGRI